MALSVSLLKCKFNFYRYERPLFWNSWSVCQIKFSPMQPESIGFFRLKNGPFYLMFLGLRQLASLSFQQYSEGSISRSANRYRCWLCSAGGSSFLRQAHARHVLSYQKFLSSDSSLAADWKFLISRSSRQFLSAKKACRRFSFSPVLTVTQRHRRFLDSVWAMKTKAKWRMSLRLRENYSRHFQLCWNHWISVWGLTAVWRWNKFGWRPDLLPSDRACQGKMDRGER